jgi:hypothetical protein
MPIEATLFICTYCKDYCQKTVQNVIENFKTDDEIAELNNIMDRCAYILCEAVFDTEEEALGHEENCKFNLKNKNNYGN